MYQIYLHETPNGKIYVGCTSQSLNRRWRNGDGYVRNTAFYADIQKYGWENIRHVVLYKIEDEEQAKREETRLISEYKSSNPMFGYNISDGDYAESRVAESTRRLLSEKGQGRFAGETNPNYGRKHTDEERKVMSEKARLYFQTHDNPNKGRKRTAEERKKQSESRKNSPVAQEAIARLNASKAKKVMCLETGRIYASAREVQRVEGFRAGNIGSACRGLYEKAYGYHWQYL